MSIYNPPPASELEPGGSPTQVQYNLDGISLGGLDGSSVDDTNQRLGIQVTTPQAPVHVAGTVGSGINNVTIGSVVQTAETLPTAPSGTITQIAEPSAGSGGSGISFVNPGSGTAIVANGTNYYFRVYPVLVSVDQGGTAYYKAGGFEQFGPTTDPNDSQNYDVQIDNGSVTISGETVEYFVEYSTDGSNYSPLGRTPTTTTVYTALSGSDDTVAWPTYYNNTPGTPPNAYTGGSANPQNIGFGGLSEVGNTILVEVDSVATINSVDYVSGTPTSGSFDDTGLGTYDAEISWTDNGAATNSITRISQDSGSTWYYQYTGSSSSPYLWTSLTNDPAAEARWGQTYSAGSVTYDFEPYGKDISATGNSIYGLAGTTYSTTIPADGINYIFKHSFTGLSVSYGAKILAPQSSPAYGKLLTGSFTDYYDPGYNSWSDGTTVTPNHYGYTGTQQNRSYQIYSYNPTLGIYGTTPTTVSTSDTGGYKYNTVSWTLPSGVDRVKILLSINGGGYNAGRIVVGTSLIDDALQSFGDGTTVTPTSIIPETARFDRLNTAPGNTTIVGIVSTGGGQYPKLGFGVANDSASAATYYSWLYSYSGTGYISAVTGRLILENSAGATPSTYIGGAGNVFNNNNANVDTVIKGVNNSNLFQADASVDTIYMGYSSQPADNQASVDIGRRTGTDNNIFIETGSTSNTGEAIKISAGGSFVGGWDAAARMYLGLNAPNTGAYLAIGGSAVSRDQIVFSANTIAANATGSFNRVGDDWFGVTGGIRKLFVRMENQNTATPGRVPIYTTGGYLTQLGNFTYATNRLSPTYITLAAGTNTAGTAPLVMTSGTLLGTPIAGAVEFLTDKWYATITTGAARKELTLNDIALTSGRVPFATTNGRLTDDADMTFSGSRLTVTDLTSTNAPIVSSLTAGRVVFAGASKELVDDADFTFAADTLTVTKIAATTFTGNITISTKDIVTDTTTGTKLGTATSQKIGIWNATPDIQPTNAITAAAFVANTSGIADDSATFGGYTIGQVVAALKRLGALA